MTSDGLFGQVFRDLQAVGDPLLSTGKRQLHEEIPWHAFKEDEIIYLLMEHFSLLRFTTHSPHFADPSHESGIDLEARKRSRRILVAVKKRPQNSDRGQLQDLSRSPASRRIYVHISSPTEGFRRDMSVTRNVEYWSPRELTLELVESGLVFSLMFDNSPLLKAMKLIFACLLKWGDSSRGGKIPKLTAERLAILWGFKDRAVQLNKGSRLVQIVLERGYERRRIKKNLNLTEELLDLCSTALHQLCQDAALPMLRLLLSQPDTLRFGARMAYRIDPARSNWKGLASFLGRIEGAPGKILGTEKPTDRIAPIVFKGEPISALRMHDASSVFRILSTYAFDLEEVVDDIFNVARGRPLGSDDMYYSPLDYHTMLPRKRPLPTMARVGSPSRTLPYPRRQKNVETSL